MIFPRRHRDHGLAACIPSGVESPRRVSMPSSANAAASPPVESTPNDDRARDGGRVSTVEHGEHILPILLDPLWQDVVPSW